MVQCKKMVGEWCAPYPIYNKTARNVCYFGIVSASEKATKRGKLKDCRVCANKDVVMGQYFVQKVEKAFEG
jgi:hypothetical protein